MLQKKNLFTGLLFVIIFGLFPYYRYLHHPQLILRHSAHHRPSEIHSDNLTLSKKEGKNVLNYFLWRNHEACRFSYEYGGFVIKAGTPRGIDGQKPVCLDPGVAPDTQKCLVYSFGINNDFSFDQAMEGHGCDVYAFDPSMSTGNYSPSARIKFFQMGLSTENIERNHLGWRMATLPTIWEYFGHTNRTIDILKIDIEGGEWDILRQIFDNQGLPNVKQLAVEFHLLDCEKLSSYKQFVEKMERFGFVRFFSREAVWWRDHFLECLGVHDSYAYEMAWFNSNFSRTANR